MIQDFKAFLLKHNVVSLAIGFIMGAAVGKVVTSLVTDLIMPMIGLAIRSGDWRTLAVETWGAKFMVGNFLGNVVDFAIIAFVIYVATKAMIKPDPTPETKACPGCLEPVAKAARRCKFCTESLA